MSGENSISSVVASLSGGAGIDMRKLAEDLTNVERLPVEERLTRSRDQESAQISHTQCLSITSRSLYLSLKR